MRKESGLLQTLMTILVMNKTLIIGGGLEPHPMNLFLMKRSIIENDGLGVCHVEVWETTL